MLVSTYKSLKWESGCDVNHRSDFISNLQFRSILCSVPSHSSLLFISSFRTKRGNPQDFYISASTHAHLSKRIMTSEKCWARGDTKGHCVPPIYWLNNLTFIFYAYFRQPSIEFKIRHSRIMRNQMFYEYNNQPTKIRYRLDRSCLLRCGCCVW